MKQSLIDLRGNVTFPDNGVEIGVKLVDPAGDLGARQNRRNSIDCSGGIHNITKVTLFYRSRVVCSQSLKARQCTGSSPRNRRQPMTIVVRLKTSPNPHNVTISTVRKRGRPISAGKSSVCSAL